MHPSLIRILGNKSCGQRVLASTVSKPDFLRRVVQKKDIKAIEANEEPGYNSEKTGPR